MNLARSRAKSNSFAIGTCCKVAEQIIQRITFQAFIANDPFKPAFRCIPYTCTTLPSGNYNPFAIVAPRSGARRMLLAPDINRRPMCFATICEVFTELLNGARS